MSLITILLWSTQALVLSKAFSKTHFSAILFPAFFTSSIFFMIYKSLFIKKSITEVTKLFKNEIKYLSFGIVFYFLYHYLLFAAINIGPKIEANLANFLWPLFFILFGYLTLNNKFINSSIGQKFSRVISRIFGNTQVMPEQIYFNKCKIFKLILGFCGIVLIVTHNNLFSLDLTTGKGPLLGLCAALCWALFSIYLKFIGDITYIATFTGGSTILYFIFWLHSGAPDIFSTLPHSIYLGLFPLGFAMILWEKSIKEGHTKKIGTIAFLAPIFSTALLVIFKIEQLNRISLIGAILIIFSNISFEELYKKIKQISLKRTLNLYLD